MKRLMRLNNPGLPELNP